MQPGMQRRIPAPVAAAAGGGAEHNPDGAAAIAARVGLRGPENRDRGFWFRATGDVYPGRWLLGREAERSSVDGDGYTYRGGMAVDNTGRFVDGGS